MRIKRAPTMCCVCHLAPVFQWNRCAPCARTIDPELKRRLQAMTAGQRKIEYAKMMQAARAKFEWLGDEESLAKMFGQETQKNAKSQEKING